MQIMCCKALWYLEHQDEFKTGRQWHELSCSHSKWENFGEIFRESSMLRSLILTSKFIVIFIIILDLKRDWTLERNRWVGQPLVQVEIALMLACVPLFLSLVEFIGVQEPQVWLLNIVCNSSSVYQFTSVHKCFSINPEWIYLQKYSPIWKTHWPWSCTSIILYFLDCFL